MGALLLLWPVAALIIIGITVVAGSKSLSRTFQEYGLPSQFVWLSLLIILFTGIGIFAVAAKLMPKEYWHPFFGPYGLFIAYFSAHLLLAGVFRSLSVIFNSVVLLVISSSTLVGVVVAPIVLVFAVDGNETAMSFLKLFLE